MTVEIANSLDERPTPQAAAPPRPRLSHGQTLPLLTILFVASGCSALIYEIVWLQSLQLVIGSSAVSLGILLGTFMGGMCLGSLLLPRIVSPRRHPLRLYAMIELGIGLIGIILLFGLPHVDRLYTTHIGHHPAGILMRGLVCALCLLAPTMLMGATLPAIARWVRATPQGVSWLGFFYGGNTAGAVLGCLLAGFYLLRVHDMAVATYVAAALNARSGDPGPSAGRPYRQSAAGRQTGRTCRLQPTASGLRPLHDLRRHRPLRFLRPRGRSRLDARPVAAPGRNGLHLLHHPGGVPGGPGSRQRRRVCDRPQQPPAATGPGPAANCS